MSPLGQFARLADAQADEVFVRREARVALEECEESSPSIAHEAGQVVDAEVLSVMPVDELDGRLHHLRPRGDERFAQDGGGAEENAAAEAADKAKFRRGQRLAALEIACQFADRGEKA